MSHATALSRSVTKRPFLARLSQFFGRGKRREAAERISAASATALFEPLEKRELMSATLAGGVLTVNGTNLDDVITVTQSGPSIFVNDNGVGSSFPLRSVFSITLNGGVGRDQLLANDSVTRIITANGGPNDDIIRGGAWADKLYGGDGNDIIDGGAGNDGLFGGINGTDRLTGGAGVDHFLVQGTNVPVLINTIFVTDDTITDQTSTEARIQFASGDKPWADAEVAQVDKGLAFLVLQTNNTKLLKLSGGSEQQFQRFSTLPSSPGITTLGDNDSRGLIRLADGSAGAFDVTAVHELGHNWDTENPLWANFMALSSWQPLATNVSQPPGFVRATSLTGEAQPWTFSSNAQFARLDGYGHTNPNEDFATSLETYYTGNNPKANWQAKYNFIQSFLSGLSHDIYGEIGKYYATTPNLTDAYGRTVRSILGFATSDEQNVPGRPGARMQSFQGGTIYWSPTTGAHAVYGAIGALYRQTAQMTDAFGKNVQAILGLPISDERDEPFLNGGRQTNFQGGTIYWSERTGAHVVFGAIGAKFDETVFMTDAFGQNLKTLLGLPTSNEVDVPGRPGARMNTFEHGTIYWSPGTGAHVVYGAIGGLYASFGGAAGFLGLPTSDELSAGVVRFNHFEHGNIEWTPNTGAFLF